MGNLRMNADQISYKGGEKPMSVEEAIKNAGNTGLAHTADIAPDFSAESAYNAGDLVYHNGTLYVFTSNHAAGAWSTDDTQAVTVGGELADVKNGLTNLLKRGYFNIACQQGQNVFDITTAQLVSGSFPDVVSDCLFQIVNHGSSYSPPNIIEVDGSNTIIITATAAQNIQVMWIQFSNIPLTN